MLQVRAHEELVERQGQFQRKEDEISSLSFLFPLSILSTLVYKAYLLFQHFFLFDFYHQTQFERATIAGRSLFVLCHNVQPLKAKVGLSFRELII